VHLFGVRLCPHGRARRSGRAPIAWARRSRRRAIVGTPRPPCPPYTNRNRPQCLLRVMTYKTQSEHNWSVPLHRGRVRSPIFHRDAIAVSRSASARISIVPEIWLSGSSTGSSTVAGSQRAMTSWRRTTSLSFSLLQSGYGCALMSPRPRRPVWRAGAPTYARVREVFEKLEERVAGTLTAIRGVAKISGLPYGVGRHKWT